MKIKYKILDKRLGTTFPLPTKGTPGSAGYDMRAMTLEPINIKAGETILIPTGIAIHINDKEFAGLLLPRSGLGHKHGIILGNSIGLIDSDYQDQIYVSCHNRSNIDFMINPGDRIAQLIIVPVIDVEWIPHEEEVEETIRGLGGFGHTGVS